MNQEQKNIDVKTTNRDRWDSILTDLYCTANLPLPFPYDKVKNFFIANYLPPTFTETLNKTLLEQYYIELEYEEALQNKFGFPEMETLDSSGTDMLDVLMTVNEIERSCEVSNELADKFTRLFNERIKSDYDANEMSPEPYKDPTREEFVRFGLQLLKEFKNER